jgi:hypothetical protein
MIRVIALILLLSGCATVTPIQTSDGTQYLIQCNGAGVPWSACFRKANEQCAEGYDLLAQNTEHGPYAGAVTGGVGGLSAPRFKSLRIKCR